MSCHSAFVVSWCRNALLKWRMVSLIRSTPSHPSHLAHLLIAGHLASSAATADTSLSIPNVDALL